MFSFQPNGHLVYGTPTTSQGYQIPDDLIADHHDFMETNLISFGNHHSKHVGITPACFEPSSLQTESKNECTTVKKVVHREVEEKRRQDMSDLYSSLGSLLPPTQIKKGKRSVCDQIEEATNHIKHKEKSIGELRLRRDKLRKSFNHSGSGPKILSSDDGNMTVNLVSDGIEILISGSSDLGLSRLLAVLVQRELDVVSCISTRTKERFVHKIKIKAPQTTNIDVSELQDRLSDAIIK